MVISNALTDSVGSWKSFLELSLLSLGLATQEKTKTTSFSKKYFKLGFLRNTPRSYKITDHERLYLDV